MRARLAIATVACAIAAVVAEAPAAWADSVATGGGASSITRTSAVLNGTANVSNPDSAWAFEYGTTTAYGHYTPARRIGAGVYAVSALVPGLRPATTYHFRLVVVEDASASQPDGHLAGDMTFTTQSGGGGGGGRGSKRNGHASLLSHALGVSGGVVSIGFRCAGSKGAHCRGTASLSARGKKGKTVRCGSARFSALAGKRGTARGRLTGACMTLLRNGRNHELRATLRVTFSTHQPVLKTTVTLVG